jgi:hypothetical protein
VRLAVVALVVACHSPPPPPPAPARAPQPLWPAPAVDTFRLPSASPPAPPLAQRPPPPPDPATPRPRGPHASIEQLWGIAPWSSACAARGHVRDGYDLDTALTYTFAWCAVLRDDEAAARAGLLEVAASTDRRLATAARIDLADVLVMARGADVAIAWLRARNLADDAMLDELAAAYLDDGRSTDALVAIRASSGRGALADRCRRLAIERALDPDAAGRLDSAAVSAGCPQPARPAPPIVGTCPLVTGTWTYDSCRNARCDIAMIEHDLALCEPELVRAPQLRERAIVVAAHAHWPAQASADDWLAFAKLAARGASAPGGDALVLAALANAALLSDCSDVTEIASVARALPKVRPELAARLAELVGLTPARCRDRR